MTPDPFDGYFVACLLVAMLYLWWGTRNHGSDPKVRIRVKKIRDTYERRAMVLKYQAEDAARCDGSK